LDKKKRKKLKKKNKSFLPDKPKNKSHQFFSLIKTMSEIETTKMLSRPSKINRFFLAHPT